MADTLIEAAQARLHNAQAAARMLLFTVVMWRLADAPAAELDDAIAVLVAGLTTALPSAGAAEAEPHATATARRRTL
jgi:hypothetical protein